MIEKRRTNLWSYFCCKSCNKIAEFDSPETSCQVKTYFPSCLNLTYEQIDKSICKIITSIIEESRFGVIVAFVFWGSLLWLSRSIESPEDMIKTRLPLTVESSNVVAYFAKTIFVRPVLFRQVSIGNISQIRYRMTIS